LPVKYTAIEAHDSPFRQLDADLIHSAILFKVIINVPQEHYFTLLKT